MLRKSSVVTQGISAAFGTHDLGTSWADAVARYESQVAEIDFETKASREEARAMRQFGG